MKSKTLSTIDLVVTGEAKLHCEGCEERVSKVLRQVSGVESVDANAETQEVKVAFDTGRVQPGEICATLQRMGYQVDTRNGQRSRESRMENRGSKGEGAASESDRPTAYPRPTAETRHDNSRPKERRFDVPPLSDSSLNPSSSDATSADPTADGTGGLEKLQVKIGGMECSFCVGTITKALTRMDGVDRVSVNMAHEEALITYDPSRVTPTDLKQTLREIGYNVRDLGNERTFEEQEAELRAELKNLLLAAAFAAIAFNFMALMWLDFLAMDRAWPFMIWLAPTLALSTMFGPGWRFLNMAWASLKRGILNQHVLMEFGACAGLVGGFLAYVVDFPESAFSRLIGVDYPVLFDFFGVVVFINTYHFLSAYVSLVVRTRASQAVRKLLDLVPPTASVVRDGREVDVPIEEVERGELVRVRPGESIPLDGEVVEGASGVDESLVTGESIPQEMTVGDEVIGGSFVQAGTLLIRVTKVGAEGFVQQVARQVEEARALKPGVLVLVDQVLKVFVPAVLGFAVTAFLIWTLGAAIFGGSPDWTRALLATLAVLVMGYPCALGMATPLAMIRGGGMAAERGILMRSGGAFQALKDVRKVVLDKTGTITRGEPAVVEVVAFGDHDADSVVRLAAAAESGSEHPLGQAILSVAEQLELSIAPAEYFQSTAGKGVRATVAGSRVLVGKPRYLVEENVDLEPAQSRLETMQREGDTVVVLAVDGELSGLIAIADQVKADAKDAVDRMRQAGLEPVMLTGDNERTARAVAEQVGITEYRAEVLPQDKADAVREFQRQGHRVVMVGDGINDAPALMQADVGIAIGAGTDIAIDSADIVILGERLGAVVDAYEIGKESYKKTVQNLILAFSFNGIGVPLAVTGLVHPVWAMIAMATSVSTVLANSFGGRLLKEATATEKTGNEHASQHPGRRRSQVGHGTVRASVACVRGNSAGNQTMATRA